MADTLNTSLKVSLDVAYADTSDISQATTLPFKHTINEFLADGTTANLADVFYHDQATITTSSSTDYDLAGTLTNVFGATATFANVKGILIQNTTTTSTYIVKVGAKGSNDFVNWVASATDIVQIGAGGTFLLTAPVDGFDVTADSGDILKIANDNAGSVTINVVIWGSSA